MTTLFFDTDSIPIIYDKRYNVCLYGFERYHPFDTLKWRHIVRLLEQYHVTSKRNLLRPNEPLKHDLLVAHSQEYLNSLNGIVQRDEFVFRMCSFWNVPIAMVLGGGYTQQTAKVVADSIANLAKQGLILTDTNNCDYNTCIPAMSAKREFEMPRKWKRATDRNTKNMFAYQQAYQEILLGNSLRTAAAMFNLDHVSLRRYKKKRENASKDTPIDSITMGYNSAKKVFNAVQEIELSNYAIKSADIYFGLSTKDLRQLAFNLAIRYEIKGPASWNENGIAGIDWLRGFFDRHPEISARCAQATSLSKATRFNKYNVEEFFAKLLELLELYKFESKNIYNLDETGISTSQKSNRIVDRKITRQVGAVTSAEPNTSVKVSVIANAIGDIIPPMFTFPRAHCQSDFDSNGPIHNAGAVNESLWVQEEDFLTFLKHFQRHTKCSKEDKVLLLHNNHSSRVSLVCIDYCDANGIVMLSYPPHCSHKLQPLNRSIYSLFRRAVNIACERWIKANPEKSMNIYDIPKIAKTALSHAMNRTNIQAGFRCTGICPFNKDVFTDLDFPPSYGTIRSDPRVSPTRDEDYNSDKEDTVADPISDTSLDTSAPAPEKSVFWEVTEMVLTSQPSIGPEPFELLAQSSSDIIPHSSDRESITDALSTSLSIFALGPDTFIISALENPETSQLISAAGPEEVAPPSTSTTCVPEMPITDDEFDIFVPSPRGSETQASFSDSALDNTVFISFSSSASMDLSNDIPPLFTDNDDLDDIDYEDLYDEYILNK